MVGTSTNYSKRGCQKQINGLYYIMQTPMKKKFFWATVFLSILFLAARLSYQPLLALFGPPPKAGLKITSLPSATVLIDGKEAGRTPYEDQSLKEGQYLVQLRDGNSSWQDRIRLNRGTWTVVNRELGPSSSGEVLTLSQGQGVVITSQPGEAEIEVDGKARGKTPLSISDLSSGEHTFLVSHSSYLKRSIKASLPPGLALYIDASLALTEADLSSLAMPTVAPVITLIVKQTPLGFVRVRDKASLSGKEVGRLTAGEILTQLEELPGWVRVRLKNGTEGYVSSQYVQRQS